MMYQVHFYCQMKPHDFYGSMSARLQIIDLIKRVQYTANTAGPFAIIVKIHREDLRQWSTVQAAKL